MNEWIEVEFVGGPLDGTGRVHPQMNYHLRVEGHPGGVYLLGSVRVEGRTTYEWAPEGNRREFKL